MRERAADRAAVPDLRVADRAGRRAASSGTSAASTSEDSTPRCRVPAPIATSSPSTSMYDSSRNRPMSMTSSGAASRSFITGSSEWPPASTVASSPCSASSASAPSSESGRA